ncbi:MAG: preprotein translocase subunit SecE [Desulfosalsimonas sp.]
MARMQKKKPTDKKKKNKSAGDSDSGSSAPVKEAASAAEVSTEASAGIEAKQKKQKSSFSVSGGARRGSEQTFVVRLLNKYFGNWIQFLREVKVELARVTWPARKETVMTTAVVLVFVFIVAIFLGLVDFVLTNLVRLIL